MTKHTKRPKRTDPIDEQRHLAEVLQAYPLKIKAINLISDKGKKAVWEIVTTKGSMILKKSPALENRLIFINAATRHLLANNVLVPDVILTSSGSDYAAANENLYVMTKYVTGSRLNYESPHDLKAMMQGLALFHKGSRHFSPPPESRIRSHLGLWEKSYLKKLDKLEQYKILAGSDSGSFSKKFLSAVDHFIEQGRRTLEIIRSPVYEEWVEKVKETGNLCHQDYAEGNLLLTKKGVVAFDMDSITIDVPARDLRKILNKVMKKHDWDLSRTIHMLAAYQEIHPLTADEYDVLYADVLFPNLFYGIASKYYNLRATDWGMAKIVEKLEMIVTIETQKEAVLAKWKKIVKKVSG